MYSSNAPPSSSRYFRFASRSNILVSGSVCKGSLTGYWRENRLSRVLYRLPQ
jgi:hypothetical protein